MSPQELLAAVSRVAVEAGEAILEVYARDFDVEQKADESPLTQADLASHHIIVSRLPELTPDIPILSEESASIDYATRRSWNEYWLVDPLDGTKEFINRNGEFTVNIALIRDGRPVMGVVHVPVQGTTFSGLPGEGAWKTGPGGTQQAISVRTPCANPLVVVGSRSHANPRLEGHLRKLGDYELISMGSSLKFCLVAEGSADFYPRLGPTSEWDTAAAHAVVAGAGGQVVQLNGDPLEYNRKESLLNPEFLVIADSSRDWLSAFSPA